jgi:3-hydroxyisobutyrate dehydrogenase-like beta-hydroxyacid dehydrogenase
MATGFLHPGAMGASLAAACRDERLWCGKDRSEATRARAETAGMHDVGSIDALVERADVIIAVCPPGAAIDVARSVARVGFDGIYVDVNAISPATARLIGSEFERFVDGGVVGTPVEVPGSTRLYLSGDDAQVVAGLWAGTALEPRLVDGGAGAASAVKVCFAAWTKGTAALLLAIRALAVAEGVEKALLAEWATSMPGLVGQSERAASGNAPKAWRFEGELAEIAQSFTAHGLPEGFGRAAAEVYARLAGFKDIPGTTLDEVVEALNRAERAAAPPSLPG